MQVIYLIDNDDKLNLELNSKLFTEKEFRFKNVMTDNLDMALKDIPAAIIINEDSIEEDIVDLVKQIRTNDDNAITPLIVVSSNIDKDHKLRVLDAKATYYLEAPVDIDCLYQIVKNIVGLLFLNRKVSPLTNLPGNVQIQSEIRRRLLKNEYFVMLYFDLDNFKSYNDYYGFAKGDEIIKFTAKTIIYNVHMQEDDNNFIGHVGGDDFVAIVDNEDFEKICQNIILNFDQGVREYYEEEDLERGYLEITNRKGVVEEFPITSISIGAVEVNEGRFNNSLEIGEAAAQVKHLAKTIQGSTYVVDRRKSQ